MLVGTISRYRGEVHHDEASKIVTEKKKRTKKRQEQIKRRQENETRGEKETLVTNPYRRKSLKKMLLGCIGVTSEGC